MPREEYTAMRWFVMRDLKRANALLPAYKMLQNEGFEIFTPMKWRLTLRRGRKVREEVPYMQDLLFVHAAREALDPVVRKTPTLQYRYVRGSYCEPMVVPDADMVRFIGAVQAADEPCYYLPEEITPQMCGRRIRVIGGPLDGYEGNLLLARGSRTRRLLLELPNFLTVGVEVNPDYIQFV